MERGRPTKYKEEYNEQAYKLCLLGATDKDLALFFEVNEDTIHEWKKVHENFSESISLGKAKADMEVAHSLYSGTKDRVVVEEQAIKVKCGRFEERVEVVKIEKVIPGDFRNQQFWLKNRKSDKWRDKAELDVNTNQVDLSKLSEEELIIFSQLQQKLNGGE
jgi:acyl-CoA hydrolase